MDIRDKILEKIPSLNNTFWSYYDSAYDMMSQIVWTKIHPNIRSTDPLAFVTRSRKTTGVFEVYINPNIPYECRKPFELHEFGHVIFTHMSLMSSQREILINKIMASWGTFEKYFDKSITQSKANIEVAAKVICDAILNIAMDYEVNSKLFTIEEWETFKDIATWAYIRALALSPDITESQLEEVLDWINDSSPDKEPCFKPCWPEDQGFPLKLDYRQYIDLMLMKPDETMERLLNDVNKSLNQQQTGNSNNSNGLQDNDSESNNDNSTGSGSSGSGKLTKEDVDKLRKKHSDANEQESNATLDEAEKQDREEKGKDSKSERQKDNKANWSPTGSSLIKKEEVLSIYNDKLLEKKLLKELFNRHIIDTKQDYVYHYNRQKYNSNLMISKNKSENLYRPGNVYLLVDCSGSIGSRTLGVLIGVIKKISKKCGPHSRLIWWDTRCKGDYPIRTFKNPRGNGGTDISKGIRYVHEKYLKRSNDKLIIISDYFDSLSHWYDELKLIKHDCIGICWKNISEYVSESEYINMCNVVREDIVFDKKFLKKLPTTLVLVPKGFEKMDN